MTDILLPTDDVPRAGAVLNPFVIVDDASGFLEFVTAVFDVPETVEARTPMPDGSLIHAEVRLGNADLMVADRRADWPARPGLLQVWVRDVGAVLARAEGRGAEVVTSPVPFYGETTLARMLDPWDTLWWLYSPAPGQPDPEPGSAIFTTVDAALRALYAGG